MRQSIKRTLYCARIQQGGAEQLAGQPSHTVAPCTTYFTQPFCRRDHHDMNTLSTSFLLLAKLLDDFTAKIPQSSFSNHPQSRSQRSTLTSRSTKTTHADNIMRVQQELDETKIVLVRIFFLVNFLSVSCTTAA